MRRALTIALLLVVAGICAFGIAQTASAANHGHCIAEEQAPIAGTSADRLLLSVLVVFAFASTFTRVMPDIARTADSSLHRWRQAFSRVWVPPPVLLASQAIDDPQIYAPVFRSVSWQHA